jgi:hypothetical protein
VYYAGELGILQDALALQNLTLVTGGALLGIKSIGGHLKHVIALNADAVQYGAREGLELRGTLGSGRTGFGAGLLGTHDPIVACRKRPSKSSASRRWPGASVFCVGYDLGQAISVHRLQVYYLGHEE